MKLKFGFKNIRNFILALLLFSYGIYMIYIYLYESPEITALSELIIGLVFMTIITCFSVWYGVIQVVPKQFKVMRAVKKFISYSELKELVKDEVFVSASLPYKIKKDLSKSAIKRYENNFLVSKNWVYADKVMIPKKMIVSVKASFSDNVDTFYLELVNKGSFEFAVVRCGNKETKKYLTKYFSENTKISGIKNITDANEYINMFKQSVRTKDDFLRFIYD